MTGTAESALARDLDRTARQFGTELPKARIEQLLRYAKLLEAWNERINLTGARDQETLVREHVCDALALLPILPERGDCVDVGSGAGLPGIVLAVARPDLHFLLVEPSSKRRAFLASACREIDLRNVSISEMRLDSLVRSHRGSFSFAVARAVFPLGEWLSVGLELLAAGGVIAGLTGPQVPEQIPAGCEVHPYDVGAGPRTIVTLRK